jgi:hypothetical protein
VPPGSLAPPTIVPGPLRFDVVAVEPPPPLPRGIRLDRRLAGTLVASALLLGALLAAATLSRESPTPWRDDVADFCGRPVSIPAPDAMVSLGDRAPSSIGCGRFVAVAEPRRPAIARARSREPILDLVEVAARIRAISPALRRCFTGIHGPGRLVVRFWIDGEGRAVDAQAIGTDGPAAASSISSAACASRRRRSAPRCR